MNYEKEYKELVGKIKKAYLYTQTDSTKAVLEDILSELKESEDEKIRKAILELVRQSSEILEKKNQNNMIAWLEKQGERKSQRMISAMAKEAMYSNPAWSEEDEGMCRAIINDIENDKRMCKFEISKGVCDAQINWLKSLKERIGG